MLLVLDNFLFLVYMKLSMDCYARVYMKLSMDYYAIVYIYEAIVLLQCRSLLSINSSMCKYFYWAYILYLIDCIAPSCNLLGLYKLAFCMSCYILIGKIPCCICMCICSTLPDLLLCCTKITQVTQLNEESNDTNLVVSCK
jgi:hypothetical protein